MTDATALTYRELAERIVPLRAQHLRARRRLRHSISPGARLKAMAIFVEPKLNYLETGLRLPNHRYLTLSGRNRRWRWIRTQEPYYLDRR